MKRITVFFLCFLFYASLSNAQVMVKKETASGRTHYSFSNTSVNIDKYDDEVESRSMSAAEREQADIIDRENKRMRQKDQAHSRQIAAERERERQAQANMIAREKEAQRQEKLERALRRPIIVNTPAPAPVFPAPVIVNNW